MTATAGESKGAGRLRTSLMGPSSMRHSKCWSRHASAWSTPFLAVSQRSSSTSEIGLPAAPSKSCTRLSCACSLARSSCTFPAKLCLQPNHVQRKQSMLTFTVHGCVQHLMIELLGSSNAVHAEFLTGQGECKRWGEEDRPLQPGCLQLLMFLGQGWLHWWLFGALLGVCGL